MSDFKCDCCLPDCSYCNPVTAASERPFWNPEYTNARNEIEQLQQQLAQAHKELASLRAIVEPLEELVNEGHQVTFSVGPPQGYFVRDDVCGFLGNGPALADALAEAVRAKREAEHETT